MLKTGNNIANDGIISAMPRLILRIQSEIFYSCVWTARTDKRKAFLKSYYVTYVWKNVKA